MSETRQRVYIALDDGDSGILGIYSTREAAEAECHRAVAYDKDMGYEGRHWCVVVGDIDGEYLGLLSELEEA